MKEYAECFRNNLKPNQCGMSIPKEEGIERINVVIFGLKNMKKEQKRELKIVLKEKGLQQR